MPLFTRRATPLSQEEIFNHLKEARSHAVAPYSNYQVASIVEIKLQDNIFFYTSGVNIELGAHNRLSIHSEQNAIASALTLLGGDTKFSRIWIMAAPANACPEDKHSAGKSCGHCRQIMVSLAKPGAEIYAVTLDGHFSIADTFENHFLPDCFSERDLNLPSFNHSASATHSLGQGSTIFNSPKWQGWNIINERGELTIDDIMKYFKLLSPHMINPQFQTSPITACILKCNNGRYAAGVLIQDLAFLTTDAIFSALGNAVTQFGNTNLSFYEIHLASDSLDPLQISSAEIELLSSQYVFSHTKVNFYASNRHASYMFMECKDARDLYLDHLLKNNFSMEVGLETSLRAKL